MKATSTILARPNTDDKGKRQRKEQAIRVASRWQDQYWATSIGTSRSSWWAKAVHNACRYTEVRAPAPALVQELVQAWKALRRVKRKS